VVATRLADILGTKVTSAFEGIGLGTMDSEDLRKRVAAFPFWYHRIELPGGVTTPGVSPLNAEAYRVPKDLSGQRVLDVGAWDGYWTFEAIRRGAREVVAIDDFSDHLGVLPDRKGWGTFDLCREAFAYDENQCKRREMSIYDVSVEELGTFDSVFFFGTLYHLRHPLLALERLAGVCNGSIYVESAILDDYSPYNGGLTNRFGDNQLLMEFYPTNELARNSTNWWVPTVRCLAFMVSAAGFGSDVQYWKLVDNPNHIGQCRGFAVGRKPGQPRQNQNSA
jgi:tRNA (mo5U34)-methyltransferase